MTTETRTTLPPAPKPRRADLLALWGGIAFSLAFSALIWWVGQRLASVPHLPDAGPSWYYWKLPEATSGAGLRLGASICSTSSRSGG
jgi:hypothetical protein